MKSRVVFDTQPAEVAPVDLPIGTLGVITQSSHSGYAGETVLRVYDSLVSLTKPRNTWSDLEELGSAIMVRPFPKGTEVVLTAD